MSKITLVALAAFLAGCAANPSFDKNKTQMMDILRAKSVCCTDISKLTFRKINSIPYRTSTLSSSSWDMITESSQVFEFDGFKSYVMAIELPDINNDITFKFKSMQTVSNVKKGGYFSPIIRIYNKEFQEIEKYSDFGCNDDYAGPTGTMHLSKQSKYIVMYTGEKELQGGTRFYWNGSVAYCISKQRPGAGFAPMPGMAPVPVTVYERPHIPEGAFIIEIQ